MTRAVSYTQIQGTSRDHVYSGLGFILGSLFFAFRRRKKLC
ncbi:LPXTG cell wall anchor domain-containing protein [Brenneria nigrifluens DSM 30175 = ATCC 13028]|uniref:LPXTG cell wall anchor domain-containing protein n=1 Tax=Brenneria nigrifluens DSM 30175 = ATCC 13028 TaxID=1121120 RepID=A0A2U1UX58_9GAMM|nr:hypothetical protein DDT54_01605 [Brenneria nigrifluens DSM 30175 = ATCC 13028]QCR06984.1 LPXTG cell wall anchor domain-containing protein [Brenneria nigrifluens DSM 30175 = ATCC 13028]